MYENALKIQFINCSPSELTSLQETLKTELSYLFEGRAHHIHGERGTDNIMGAITIEYDGRKIDDRDQYNTIALATNRPTENLSLEHQYTAMGTKAGVSTEHFTISGTNTINPPHPNFDQSTSTSGSGTQPA